MADPLSICASVVSLAGAGLKLSTTLYTYSATAFKADKELRDIAENVSVTSSVLDQLGRVLEEDKKAKLCTDSALKTTESVAERCKSVFQELDVALQKSLSKSRDGKMSTVQKMKWPFLEPKIKLAQSNLESIKSTLLLMLNVVSYARNVAQENRSDEVQQRELIASLIETNKETNRRFEDMQILMKSMEMNTFSRSTTLQVDATSLFSRSSTLAEQGIANARSTEEEINDVSCKLCQEEWPTKSSNPHYKLQDLSASITEIRGLLEELIQAEEGLKLWNDKSARKSCSDIRDAFNSTIEVLRPIFAKEDSSANSGAENKPAEASFPTLTSTPQERPTKKMKKGMKAMGRRRRVSHHHVQDNAESTLHVSHSPNSPGYSPESSPDREGDFEKLNSHVDIRANNIEDKFPANAEFQTEPQSRQASEHHARTNYASIIQLRTLEAQKAENNQKHTFSSDAYASDPYKVSASQGSHALQDYQMQLMLLDQQNKKRLLMARQAQESMSAGLSPSSDWKGKAPAAPMNVQQKRPVPIGNDQKILHGVHESTIDIEDILENLDYDSFAHTNAGEGISAIENIEPHASQSPRKKRNSAEPDVRQQNEKSDGAAESNVDPVQDLLSKWTTVFDKDSTIQRENDKFAPAMPEWQEFAERHGDMVTTHDREDAFFGKGGFEF